MPAEKRDVIDAIRSAQQEVERLVSSTPESAWSKQAYEQGWNAKQLLSHIASTSRIAGFLISMAKAPGSGGMGADFDIDAFNAQQVAARQEKPVMEVLEEVRGNCQRDIESVQDAPDDLLAQHFRAPWDMEGSLGDVIVGSIEGHFMVHVRELAKAVS
jgi:uncharacterized damage-inducible protein DinB